MLVIKRKVSASNLSLLRGVTSDRYSRDKNLLQKDLLPDQLIYDCTSAPGYVSAFPQRYEVDFYTPAKWMSTNGFIVN